MKSRPILVDSTLQELTEHGDEHFAMSMDRQDVRAKNYGNVPHWHYEIQISLVTEGTVIFRAQGSEYRLRAGEGIFINSGCLHEAVPENGGPGTYVCVNFHPKIIYGYQESLLRIAYVDPVLFSSELQVIELRGAPWHREICALMRDLARAEISGDFGYEVEMYSIVLKMWHIIVKNKEQYISQSTRVTFAERQRIKTLTNFIRRNYMYPISLVEIADAGCISKGECCRIFKRVLGTTPFKYLISFRIRQSLKLLSMSNMNISEIAQAVGFGSGSYFTECFKKTYNISPIAYRKQRADKKGEEAACCAVSE